MKIFSLLAAANVFAQGKVFCPIILSVEFVLCLNRTILQSIQKSEFDVLMLEGIFPPPDIK